MPHSIPTTKQKKDSMTTYNTSIFMGEGLDYIDKACIEIKDGKISGLDTKHKPKSKDLKDLIALPSLFNAHTHMGDAFAKEASLGLNVSKAVGSNGKKWNLLKHKNVNEQREAIKGTLSYLISSGTAGFCDFREEGKLGIQILIETIEGSPVKTVILGREDGAEGSNGWGINVYSKDEILKKRKGRIVAIHAGEAPDEIRKALELKPDIIVHATNATNEEIKEISRKNISVIVCPRANASMGVGYPPVRQMIDAGITVGLGTDNVMVNQPNLWREMEYLIKSSFLHGPLTTREVFQMATVNPRKIFGQRGGTIEEGQPADLIFIEKNAPNLNYSKDLLATIVTRCEPENVKKVMISGKFVYEK
ncbi:MAG: amidohydrolase family protein [Candidatus Altiarchaeota archaeon]